MCESLPRGFATVRCAIFNRGWYTAVLFLVLRTTAFSACRDCSQPGFGGPGENRFTAYDSAGGGVFVNLSNLTLIEEILEERPEIELLSAMQGQVGLDLARQHSPDLILLDLHLPDLPGWEVLSQLKLSETTADIPVVVISADATPSQIKRLIKAGAVSYLTKPLDVTEFFRVLDNTIVTDGTKASLPNSNGELMKARL